MDPAARMVDSANLPGQLSPHRFTTELCHEGTASRGNCVTTDPGASMPAMSITVIIARDDAGAPTTREVYESGVKFSTEGGDLSIVSAKPQLIATYGSGNWLSVHVDDNVEVITTKSDDDDDDSMSFGDDDPFGSDDDSSSDDSSDDSSDGDLFGSDDSSSDDSSDSESSDSESSDSDSSEESSEGETDSSDED
jgi:hypothetical protein